jgi:hypothetical protein
MAQLSEIIPYLEEQFAQEQREQEEKEQEELYRKQQEEKVYTEEELQQIEHASLDSCISEIDYMESLLERFDASTSYPTLYEKQEFLDYIDASFRGPVDTKTLSHLYLQWFIDGVPITPHNLELHLAQEDPTFLMHLQQIFESRGMNYVKVILHPSLEYLIIENKRQLYLKITRRYQYFKTASGRNIMVFASF